MKKSSRSGEIVVGILWLLLAFVVSNRYFGYLFEFIWGLSWLGYLFKGVGAFLALLGVAYIIGGVEKVRNRDKWKAVRISFVNLLIFVVISAASYGGVALLAKIEGLRLLVDSMGHMMFIYVFGSLIGLIIFSIVEAVRAKSTVVSVLFSWVADAYDNIYFSIDGDFFVFIFKLILCLLGLIFAVFGYPLTLVVRAFLMISSLLGIYIYEDSKERLELIAQAILVVIIIAIIV